MLVGRVLQELEEERSIFAELLIVLKAVRCP